MGIEYEATKYLQRNRLANADMLEIIRRGSADILHAGDDGVLMGDKEGGAYLITSPDQNAAELMLAMLEKPTVFDVHDKHIVPLIERRFGLRVNMECVQAVWMDDDLPREIATGFPIKPIGSGYVDRVCGMYTHCDREYISSRIEAGEIFGAFDGDILAGFIGTHAEGAMGMLEVDANYRRRSLGSALLTFIMGRQRRLGRVIYSHIETNNAASLAMHRKLGFLISDSVIYWVDAAT